MALTVSQRIASIENQLAQLKELIKEQEQKKSFLITFEYKTTKEFWGGVEPTEELIHNILNMRMKEISEAMTLYRGVDLVEVIDNEL